MSSPASTDAMRTLITAGRPHGTMSASAITEAADQVASQVQANMALRNKLSPSKYANNGQGDPLGYQSQREPLEKIADPRAFQYMRLGPGSPAAKQFVQKLTPQDREELGNNVGALERAGMLK